MIPLFILTIVVWTAPLTVHSQETFVRCPYLNNGVYELSRARPEPLNFGGSTYRAINIKTHGEAVIDLNGCLYITKPLTKDTKQWKH